MRMCRSVRYAQADTRSAGLTPLSLGEVHTYRLDGSFSFSRGSQAEGSVVSFRPCPAGHFELVVRYIDEDAFALLGLPHYRPGVSIAHEGAGVMRTAQLTSVFGSEVPDGVPSEDGAGLVTGVWRVMPALAPASAAEA